MNASRATIRMPPVLCTGSSPMYVINPMVGYKVAVHSTCICNEALALHNRHLIERKTNFNNKYFREMTKKVSKHWKFSPDKMSMWECVKQYNGGKRRIYATARAEILTTGLRKSDSYISMFVKQDKYCESQIGDKMPRAIQYRSPRYNLVLATYLRPFEKQFYLLPGLGPSETRVITKGLNKTQIADLFLYKAAHFVNPVYISCDYSKFDSTIRVEHLKAEHAIYDRTFKSGELRKLLHQQLYNKGFSRHGIKYTIKGTRMSGDYNTGLGNSLINRIVLESWLCDVPHEIMLDGDDAVIIIEKTDMYKLNMQHINKMGFNPVIGATDDILEVVYCQSRLVMGKQAIMCRNPWRALSNMAVTVNRYPPHCYRHWFSGVAEAEASINKNMPIYHSLFKLVGKQVIRDADWHRKMEFETVGPGNVVERQAFEATFGIPESMQIFIEDCISNYTGFQVYNFNTTKNGHSTLSAKKATTRLVNSIGQRFATLDSSPNPWWGGGSQGFNGYAADESSFATLGAKFARHAAEVATKAKEATVENDPDSEESGGE
nr:hypothetical protein [Leuven Tombus-like virus 3]